MQKLVAVLTTAMILCVDLGLVHAVEVPGPDGNPGNLARMLENPAVHKELAFTETDVKNVQDASRAILEIHRQDFVDAWKIEDAVARRKAVAVVFYAVTNETFAAFESLITPRQLTRLKEIELQYFGARAMTRPHIVVALKLTEAQLETYRKLANEFGEQLASAFGDKSLTPEQRAQKRAELRAVVAEKIVATMNPEQAAVWNKMLGKTFREATPAPPK